MTTEKPVYNIYSATFGESNIITDAQIQNFTNGVIDINKRLERIKELREKFGFSEQNHVRKYREKRKSNAFQAVTDSANKLSIIAKKAKLIAAYKNHAAVGGV